MLSIRVGISDPWAVSARPRPRRSRNITTVVGVALLAVAGPAARVVGYGDHQRWASAILFVGMAALAVAVRWSRVSARIAASVVLVAASAASVRWALGALPAFMATAGVAVTARFGQRHEGVEGRSVPPASGLALVLVAQIVWWRTASVGAVAPVFAAAAVVSELRRIGSAVVIGADRVLASTTAVVWHSMGALASIVVVPLWWIAGAVTDAARSRRRTPWSQVLEGDGPDRFGDRRLSHRTARAGRRSTLGVALVLVAALTVGLVESAASTGGVAEPSVVPSATAPTATPAPVTEPEPTTTVEPSGDLPDLTSLPAFSDAPWAADMFSDQSRLVARRDVVGGSSLADFSSGSTNVSAGVRTSLAPLTCLCRPTEVWFTGGSAAFGQGQRDEHTIASGLVRLAAADGLSVSMKNLGQPGWTLWQEYQSVLARLADDRQVRPSIVIFYDGFNDMVQSLVQTLAFGPRWADPVVTDDAAFTATHQRSYSADEIRVGLDAEGGTRALGVRAAKRYLALRDLIGSQLAADGIETRFVLQPDALTSPVQRAAAERLRTILPPELDDPASAVLDGAELEVGTSGLNLRHVFDDTSAPVFADLVHVNEAGGRIVADRIYRSVRSVIESRADAAVAVASADGGSEPRLAGFSLESQRVATFEFPTAVSPRPASSLLYVTERAGRVRSFDPAAPAASPRLVLDIRTLTTTESNRGLLGLTFSADGTVLYLSHTDPAGHAVVASYPMSPNGRADRSRRRVLLDVAMPFDDHNGGALHLGPDGKVWLALGDGGGWKDPGNRAQNPSDPRGKILILDPSRPNRPTVAAIGLRNPFRFSFDRLNGDLWLGDVGQEAVEEIDHLPAGTPNGTNFGWSGLEGTDVLIPSRVEPAAVPPVYEMRHDAGWCAVVGGAVYRGKELPGLLGWYVFGDLCSGRLVALRNDGVALQHGSLGVSVPALVSIDQDAAGELWLTSAEGGVYRLRSG